MASDMQSHATTVGEGLSPSSESGSDNPASDEQERDFLTVEDSEQDAFLPRYHLATTISHPQEVIGISMRSPTTSSVEQPWIFPMPDRPDPDDASFAEDFSNSVVTPPGEVAAPRVESQPEAGASGRLDTGALSESLPALGSRSNASREAIKGGLQEPRRRSSSGPGAVAEGLKKLLPDLSSLLPFRSTTVTNRADSTTESNRRKSSLSQSAQSQSQSTAVLRPSPLRNDVSRGSGVKPGEICHQSQVYGHALGMDGSMPSILVPVSQDHSKPAPLLRRSTSDNSLYLRRHMSIAASFDDTERWDHAESTHPYLRAIATSFQDSGFRLPKLPSINLPIPRPSFGDNRSKSDETRDNTLLNSGRALQDPDSGRSPPHFHSRNASSAADASKGSEHSNSAQTVVTDPNRKAHKKHSAQDDSQHPILTEICSKITGDLIVLGGYRGSVLRSAKPPHRQLWVPFKVGLNLRKADLEVGLNDEDEEKMPETIIPSGSLSHIGPFDICRRLIKHFRKCPSARNGTLRVHDYGYDWRLSPDLLSKQLLAFIENLECNHPETPKKDRGALVIAHSLGGLITRHAINERPELFSGVVYAGAPQNCVNILGPLRNGDDVLLSSRVLTAQVNFTLRTSFALLPEDGRCFIDKQTNERYDVDFFDVKTWDEYRLTPCINPPYPAVPTERRKSLIETFSDSIPSISRPRPSSWFGSREPSPTRQPPLPQESATDMMPKPEHHDLQPGENLQHSLEPTMSSSMSTQSHRTSLFGTSGSVSTTCTIPKDLATDYLTRTLARTLAFKRALVYNPALESTYPPVAILFGKKTPTVFGARVASREAIKYSDAYDDLAYAAGDGVVLASAAQLPEGYRCVKGGWVESERVHVGLLGDLEGVGKCIGAVWEARGKGVGLKGLVRGG